MKIVTFSASKGGVGKTTLSFNFGAWLAHQGKSVLLIDSDYQSNLSSTFDVFSNKHTLFDIFNDGTPEIRHISEHLDLLPASPNLDKVEVLLQQKMYREFIMMGWIKQNLDEIEKYDYIIVDTHPEFGLLTKNMIAISDYVFVPIEPSEYGFQQSLNQFNIRMNEFVEDSLDPRTGESDIDAKVFFLANRIKANTKTSNVFRNVIEKMPEVIARVPERELMNTSTLLKKPVVEMDASYLRRHGNFSEELFSQFKNMQQTIDSNLED